MITKTQLRQKLLDFVQTAKAKGNVSMGIRDYLQYIKDNYEDLDSEAKEVGDKAFDDVGEVSKKVLERMPDSVERRKFARLYSNDEWNHLNIKEIAGALEKKTHLKNPVLKETEDFFFECTQVIADFLFDITSSSLKGPDLVFIALYYSALDELIIAFHLAQHGYGPQSFSHQRTVYETLDKIQLFRKHPESIDLWSSEDVKDKEKARHELSPSEVRKKLGKKSYDPIFSHLSEMGSHPTMKYIQSKMLMHKPKDDTTRQARVYVGGSPRVDSLVFSNTGVIQILMGVLGSLTSTYAQSLLEEEAIPTLRTLFEKFRNYMLTNFCGWLKENGTDTSGMEKYLKDLDLDKFN